MLEPAARATISKRSGFSATISRVWVPMLPVLPSRENRCEHSAACTFLFAQNTRFLNGRPSQRRTGRGMLQRAVIMALYLSVMRFIVHPRHAPCTAAWNVESRGLNYRQWTVTNCSCCSSINRHGAAAGGGTFGPDLAAASGGATARPGHAGGRLPPLPLSDLKCKVPLLLRGRCKAGSCIIWALCA